MSRYVLGGLSMSRYVMVTPYWEGLGGVSVSRYVLVTPYWEECLCPGTYWEGSPCPGM